MSDQIDNLVRKIRAWAQQVLDLPPEELRARLLTQVSKQGAEAALPKLDIKRIRVDKFEGDRQPGQLPTEIVLVDETSERVVRPGDSEYAALVAAGEETS